MEFDLTQQRRHAHRLIDVLSEDRLSAVNQLLDLLVEPLAQSLAAAPTEVEDLSPETVASIHRGASSLERGEGISHDEVLREFLR